MRDELYRKAEAFVIKRFTEAGRLQTIPHLLRTVDWILHLDPYASEELLIAGVSHDIERSFPSPERDSLVETASDGYLNQKYLEEHRYRGAGIMYHFLLREDGASIAGRVSDLVTYHEVGGDDEMDLLMDADSISFFETQTAHFLLNNVDKVGVEKVRAKFKWMYDRIKGGPARQLARADFESAQDCLNMPKTSYLDLRKLSKDTFYEAGKETCCWKRKDAPGEWPAVKLTEDKVAIWPRGKVRKMYRGDYLLMLKSWPLRFGTLPYHVHESAPDLEQSG